MSLRLGPPDSAGGARNGDELQLLVMPAHGRDMGLLRTWRSPHPRPPRKHGKLHLGWSDPEERSVQDLRDRHSLGAAWTRARRSSWSEPAELWTRAPGVYRRQAVRWGRYMGVPGLSTCRFPHSALAISQVPSNNLFKTDGLAASQLKRYASNR